jgi:leucyl/phenylalanyl-tRNA---protein transferase
MTSLVPEQLLYGYTRGIFPMAEDGRIYWYDPDPRAILPLDAFHLPRRLARILRHDPFTLRVDTAFGDVIRACAAPAFGREETWIDETIIEAYTRLHELGFAHSIEAWQAGELVGGLYGVAIHSFFAGESMFSRASNASQAALVYLVQRLQQRGFLLLDVQFMTDHLRRFGAVEIPRAAYRRRLAEALAQPNSF